MSMMMAMAAALMRSGLEARPGAMTYTFIEGSSGLGGWGLGGPRAKGQLPGNFYGRTRSMKGRWKRRRHLKGRR